MASIEKTIDIIFGAVDETGAGLTSVSKNIDKTVNSISNVTQPLAELSAQALKTEASIIAMGAALVGVAVNEAGKFNASVNEIATLTDLTGDAIAGYGEDLLAYSRNSTQSLEQITAATYSAISAGIDYKDALGALSTAEQLAVAGKAELNDTLIVLVSSLNAYGLGVDEAARFSDALFNTVRLGQTTLPELSASLAQVTGIAATAGVDFEELLAAVATLTATGAPTSQAITQIKAALSNIIKPSKDASELAAQLGIEFNAAALESKGLSGVLLDVQNATGGNTAEMARLFGSVEALNGMLTLTGLGADKFADTLLQMRQGAGSTDEAFQKMSKNLDLVTQNMINNYNATNIEIGKKLLPQWTDIVKSLSSLFDGVSIGIKAGAFDPVFVALNAFGANVENFLKQVAKNLPAALEQVDFTGLIAAFDQLGLNIGGIFGGFDFTTAEGLANAIQFVIDSVETLTRVTAGIVKAWEPAIAVFISVVDAANNSSDGVKNFAGVLLGASQVFENIKPKLLAISDGIELLGKAFAIIAGVKAAEMFGGIATSITSIGVDKFAAFAFAAASLKFAIDENTAAWQDYQARQAAVNDSLAESEFAQQKQIEILKRVNAETGLSIESWDGLKSAIKTGLIVFDEANDKYFTTSKGLEFVKGSVDSTSESFDWFSDVVNSVSGSLSKSVENVDNVISVWGSLERAQEAAANSFEDGYQVSIRYNDGIYEVIKAQKSAVVSSEALADAVEDTSKSAVVGSQEWHRVQQVMLETQKQADELAVQMGELSLKKYEIDVRANVDMNTAQIVADTQRIQAAFQAATDVIGHLTDGATELWSLFSDKAGFVGGDELEAAALRMEKRLDEELELKRQMTNAMVDQAKATAERLRSGQPLISVDGGSLQPELELVFDKILKFTQVKASQEGLGMLLGI
ncbi:MAG: phage tail tape measure protein [Dechloromonas sp.]|nr:phage tail tape measure protein [Dechloromonas sp.]